MPVAVNGIYELRLRTRRSGQDLFNVFHYLATTGLDSHAQDLGDTWKLAKTSFLQQILSNAVTFIDITVVPIFGLDIEVVIPYTGGEAGDLTGQTMPSYNAMSFRYNRSSRETRAGWKRIGPTTEDVVAGDFFDAAFFVTMQNTAAALEGAVVGSESQYEPIIFRPADSVPSDPVARYQLPSSVVAVNRVTTQNSRKVFS